MKNLFTFIVFLFSIISFYMQARATAIKEIRLNILQSSLEKNL